METIVISALTSFIVCYFMMKWHIHILEKLYEKYVDFENSNIEKFVNDIKRNIQGN